MNETYDQADEDKVWRDRFQGLETTVEQPSRELTERVVAMIQQHTLEPKKLSAEKVPSRFMNYGRRVLVAAAVVMIVSLFWASEGGQGSKLFAQVQESIKKKRWVHLVGNGFDGKKIEEWFSDSQKIYAVRQDSFTLWEDLSKGTFLQHNQGSSVIFEGPIGKSNRMSLATLFFELGTKPLTVGSKLDDAVIKSVRQRSESREGRPTDIYDFVLQTPGQPDFLFSFTTDRETKLPVLMEIVAGRNKRSMVIDFPEDGPADIYAIGVSKEVSIARYRKFNEEEIAPTTWTQWFSKCKRQKDGFHDYEAVFCVVPGTPYRVMTYRDESWKLESWQDDSSALPDTQIPEDEVVRNRWWIQRLKSGQRKTVSEFDGTTLIRNGQVVKSDEKLDAYQAALKDGEAGLFLLQTLTSPPTLQMGSEDQSTVESKTDSRLEIYREGGFQGIQWTLFEKLETPPLETTVPLASSILDPKQNYIPKEFSQRIGGSESFFQRPNRIGWLIDDVKGIAKLEQDGLPNKIEMVKVQFMENQRTIAGLFYPTLIKIQLHSLSKDEALRECDLHVYVRQLNK